MVVRIVCISDTHSRHEQIDVPDGDILVHAGDFTVAGEFTEITAFNSWLGTLPHRHKFVIAGNHDLMFEREPGLARSLITNATYLQDEAAEAEGLKIYGSPWQPWFMDWAFNLKRGEELRQKWALIPEDVDVLITHGPPRELLDETPHGEKVGCEELRATLGRVRPQLHVFGHIHHSYGRVDLLYPPPRRGKGGSVSMLANASICDEAYRPTNAPIVVQLERVG